jgi:S-adenosylmethionine hydrolase
MITLASDFGSTYPAAMKGVILRESDARLVDVAHDVPRQDVRTAAFWLREVLPEFPPAVHLVVVDPGVGTDRDALVVRAGDHALVGPDNGVLLPAARALRECQSGDAVEVFVLEYEAPASHTFHGRDVFAPAAARVHETGVDAIESLADCTPTDEYDVLTFPDPDLAADAARGEVLVVDGFGNVVTNLPGSVLEGHYGDPMPVNGDRVPVERSYAHVDASERLLTVGSHGNVECAVNRGRGDEAFGLDVGDAVELLLD